MQYSNPGLDPGTEKRHGTAGEIQKSCEFS